MLGLIEIDPSDLEKKSKILTVFGQTDVRQKWIRKVYLCIQFRWAKKTITFVYVFSCWGLNFKFSPCIVFLQLPMKFCTSIWKRCVCSFSHCLITRTGPESEFDVPLNSSALVSIILKESLFFSLMLHWTLQGEGMDFIDIVNHQLSSFSSRFSK